jgi:hypothetical protein
MYLSIGELGKFPSISIYVSIYVSNYLSMYLIIYLSIGEFPSTDIPDNIVYLTRPNISMMKVSIYQSMYRSIYYQSIYLTINLLSIYLTINLSI